MITNGRTFQTGINAGFVSVIIVHGFVFYREQKIQELFH